MAAINNINDYVARSVVIYCRISTPGQKTLATQNKVCDDYVRACIPNVGLINHKNSTDSAYNDSTSRSQLGALKDVCDSTRATDLVVYNIDRLSRNVSHCAEFFKYLNRSAIRLHSTTENVDISTPNGWANTMQMVIRAETFSRDRSQRVKASIDYRRSLGGVIGSVPWGFKTEPVEVNDGGQVVEIRVKVIDPEAIPVIRFILAMSNAFDYGISCTQLTGLMGLIPADVRTDSTNSDTISFHDEDGNEIEFLRNGGFTCGDVAGMLNDYGIKSPRGSSWSSATIGSVIKNHMNDEVVAALTAMGDASAVDDVVSDMDAMELSGIPSYVDEATGFASLDAPYDARHDEVRGSEVEMTAIDMLQEMTTMRLAMEGMYDKMQEMQNHCMDC